MSEAPEAKPSAKPSDTPAGTEPADAAPAPPDLTPPEGPGFRVTAGWLIGILVLAALVTFVLHFGDVRVFLTTIRAASPPWLALAIACQAATYVCAAATWSRVLARAKARQPFRSLLRLSLVELFANQILPTGGFSGSIMVVRGLARRGVSPAIAMTALIVTTLAYYAAYLLVGLLAFILLWHRGDLNTAWLSLSIAFALIVAALAVAIFVVSRSHGHLLPQALRRWRPFAWWAGALDHVRSDLLGDPRLIFQVVGLQLALFLLDALTLWCTGRAFAATADLGSAFMAFVLASIVATLSPIPLGLGSFEGTAVGVLHILGAPLEASLAATLVLRGLTLWLPMIPGFWLIRRERAEPNPT